MSNVTSDQYAPAPVSTASNPASAPPGQQAAQQIPFTRGSRRASQQDFTYGPTALSASFSPQIGPIDIQTNGFLRKLELFVSAPIASGNSAAVAYAGDGPFNVLQNVTLQDPSSEYIINPYSGYELFLAEKYFGYAGEGSGVDLRNDPNYTKVSSTGATGGSFSFMLQVPLEDRQRDAFCAVPNSAANKNYRLQANVALSTTVYTTSPTTLQNLSVTCTNFYWTEPPASIGGVATVATPNGNGSVAYLDRETFTSLEGLSSPTLILKNVGRVYKNALFVLYSNASPSVRDDTDWPSPMTVWINGYPLYYKTQQNWWSDISKAYGLTGATRDVAGGLDTGVYPWLDLDSQPGKVNNWGDANQYFASAPSTKIQLVGNFGSSADHMVILERTIKPSSGAALYGR